MGAILARVAHLPSTGLGAVAGGAWIYLLSQAPPACQQWLSGYEVWIPGLAIFVWGALIKGPPKPAAPAPGGTP